ncbi:MAG: tyrosine-protein kinase [Chloroflexota bacterium]|nr:tyrosine-protein kinase [Chloroflexota bacterium]
MELVQYWRTVRRFAWVIVLFTLIAGITAAVVTEELPRSYEANTVALVNPTQIVLPTNGQNVLPADQLVETYVQLINTAPVRARLVAAGVPRDKNLLGGEITAKSGGNTTLISITVRDRDPNVALQVAQAIIPAFNQSLDELQTRVNPSKTSPRLEALVPWEVPDTPPSTPVSPKPLLNITFAVAAGLIAGLGLAFLLEYLDNTVKRDYDVRLRLNMPLLGLVVFRGGARRHGSADPVALVSLRHSKDPMAEAYRAIRTNVNFAVQDKQMRNLLVTSSVPGEGKTSTATNLAVVMAQAGRRVILVDADFRRPNVHKFFSKTRNVGLGNLIMGEEPNDELVQETAVPNLRIVCSGPNPPNPSELLGSPAMTSVMAKLNELCDVVVYDTPPIGAVTDATVLAGRCDGVILVVERGKTSVPAILRSKETLDAVRAPILGVVLNKVRGGEARTYYYYYYQYQGTQVSAKAAAKADKNGKNGKNGQNGSNGKSRGLDRQTVPVTPVGGTTLPETSAGPGGGSPMFPPVPAAVADESRIATLIQPATSEPPAPPLVTPEPATPEPATSEPARLEPASLEPARLEPVTSEPVASEPVASDALTRDTVVPAPPPLPEPTPIPPDGLAPEVSLEAPPPPPRPLYTRFSQRAPRQNPDASDPREGE